MPMEVDIDAIVERLSRPIPVPAKKKGRPAKSWRKLKPGDRLQLHPINNVAEPLKLIVKTCDSQGVNLMITSGGIVGKYRRFENPDWQTVFIKLKKEKAKK